ncbi:MAG: PRC-barrel domain-containing protein [Pseudomonadota bacterium]
MKKLISYLFAATVSVTAITALQGSAMAQDQNYFNDRLTLSFAPENPETGADPFSQFDLQGDYSDAANQEELHGSYDDAHELNDAWLGMPVRDAAGKIIGYVDDAFLDDEGYLTELLVSLNGSGVTVFVDQKHVEYTEVAVLVDLPLQTIASLASAIAPNVE